MKNIYRDPVSSKRTFAEMREVQMAALGCLAAAGFVDDQQFQRGIVERTNLPLSKAIESAVIGYIDHERHLLDVLVGNIADIPTAGRNGLKDRSELLEYRYDVV
jgi:hypothetical protein